jgi:DNA polymerase III subunit delta'
MIHPWNRPLWERLRACPERLTGAVLLAGPEGLGKRNFGSVLAQAILCASPQAGGEPCGACASCRLFETGSHPDFRLVEPESDEAEGQASGPAVGGGPAVSRTARAIVVGQIRELADFLAVTSHLGGAKVVLIQPADRMHLSAASALLKTLEEPGTRTVFILVADRPNRLPPTVRSRCFRIDFPIAQEGIALDWLVAKGYDQPQIALVHAGLAPLAAERLAESAFWSRRKALSDLLVSPRVDPEDIAAQVDAEDLPMLCQLLYRWCYDLVSLRLANQVRYNPDYAENLRPLADNADVLQLDSLMKELIATARTLEHPLSPRLVIEQLAIRYAQMIAGQAS